MACVCTVHGHGSNCFMRAPLFVYRPLGTCTDFPSEIVATHPPADARYLVSVWTDALVKIIFDVYECSVCPYLHR